MTVERSVDLSGGVPDLPAGPGGAANSGPPVPRSLEPPAPVEVGEPGSWSLLLVPVSICVALLLFSAVFGQI
jgi:hypothetical protein